MFNGIDEVDDVDQLRSRYDVLAILGMDGESVVHSVRCRTSGRHYAVKMIPAAARVRHKSLLAPWQAHTIQPLDHPKLMVLRAVHHLQGGSVAIAVERRRGETLAERLERGGAMRPEDAEVVLRDIAGALHYLHGRGIIHEGVRPSAIFLDRDNGHARLSLFGVDRGSDRAAVSKSCALVRAYQAPEQVLNPSRGRITQLADLHALGCVGIAMLLGRQDWARPTGHGETEHADPKSALETIWGEVPANLRNALEGCVAADPRRRLRGAGAFAAALDGSPCAPAPVLRPAGAALPDAGKWVSAARAAVASASPGDPRPRRILMGVGACVAMYALLQVATALGDFPVERLAVAEVVLEADKRGPSPGRGATLESVTLPAVVVTLDPHGGDSAFAGSDSSATSTPREIPAARNARRETTARGPRLLGVPIRQRRVELLGDVVIR